MVRAGDVSTAADGWREAFDGSRLVPAPSPAVRRAAESHLAGSQGFQLRLGRLAAAPLPQVTRSPGGAERDSPEMPEVERDLTHQLRVTLFDQNHRHFFGKTWKSPAHRMTNNKICFNEIVHCQLLETPYGSERELPVLIVSDVIEDSSLLKTIDGAHLDCVVKSHPAMVPMMHLLPENVLVSGDENIPGLAASPTGDALLRPQLLKMLPFTLNRLTISLQPSLETFESQLLQLINADCHNTKQPGPEGALSTVAIQERRLHVGVHNGWCFLDKPQVVVLELLASGARGRADSTSKRSTSDSSAPSSLPQVLGLRSSLELKMTNHQALAIVFQLEYVFSAPIGRETMMNYIDRRRAPVVGRHIPQGSHFQIQGAALINRSWHAPFVVIAEFASILSVNTSEQSFDLSRAHFMSRVCQEHTRTLKRPQEVFNLPYDIIKVFHRRSIFFLVIQQDSLFGFPLSATSSSRAAFLQCLRWGIFCPFQQPADWKGEEIQLVLRGGAKPNPYGVMVYGTEMPAKAQSSVPLSAPGTTQVNDVITFRLSSGLERKASSPKASLRTRQEDVQHERRLPSSPLRATLTLIEFKDWCKPSFFNIISTAKLKEMRIFRSSLLYRQMIRLASESVTSERIRTLRAFRRVNLRVTHDAHRHDFKLRWWKASPVQKRLPAASPPESPQGPGLSLSQLAAPCRYPTISHSSSALPWQQSFPSPLHPSLLASAHQLSHVAFSAVSNIAHLEMDLQRDGDVSPSAQNEGAQLEELPFTPVHAPVITLGMNVPSSSSVSSRSSLAHLYSAGFPQIVDCGGQVADVLDPTEPVHFDPQREETDLLQGNLPVFQFLAFTRIPIAGAGPDWPRDVYFTFQFYRFPPVTSQQLKLLTSNRVQHKTSDPLPCVLAPAGKDGTVNPDLDERKYSSNDQSCEVFSGSPGLQVQFRVDDAFLRPGEKRWFLRYLALHTMHIDIWDSESLLLIGSTAIELKYMLRQGKTAVQALHEVEVLTTDYVGEDALLTSAGLGQRSASGPMTVHTIVRGRLHVRTGNIARIAAQPHRPEIDGGRVPLHRRGLRPDDILPGEHHRHEADGGRRKLDCMAAVLQREAKEGVKAVKATGQTREAQLARERLPIEPREERSKVEGIANMLSQAITTQHLLFASLGSAEYMEFVLKNPFNVPQTVTILSDDPELSVIANTEEWQYFKALTQTPTPLEENMFQWEEGAPGPRVYLRPKESIHIPLKYQSFLCDHTMALQGPGYLPTGKGSQMAKKNLSNIVAAKTIKVAFKAEDGKPMAICQVNVEPTPHVVDQTFRLYHPELCFLKKALRLPPWHDPAVEAPDGRTHISVRCSDPNIICQTRMLVPGEPQDVYLKVPGSPSPTVKKFFVMVFTDKWMAAPSQIWQVYVHFLERVDVGCVTGQRTCQSLVLRGKQTVRKVKCFSSHPKEIQVDPEGVFVLPPSAVQELQVKVQPWRAGSRFLYVNAVDVENQRLITAWLLCLNVHQPVLSKAFEVSVPVGGGRGSSRKITYTNPYTSGRTFLLRSDHPDLLQFRQDKFQISGGESYTIGLRFAPSQSPGSVEIMVYVNNLEEKTEETFCVKVNYS
ncbi:hypothetical protein F2P81_012083 [Scophthalmus maximus]|uniref:Nephrocystin-4 n=1 Tax=Scophthalmus maximus TaxID=52904 RepID=A0A6A4T0H5_SCOMX|nr:hypothetical protein F2P81_012083 [Scophthalmus maximus]